MFTLGVEGAGGFVQQQDRRVDQQGAGDGQALALAAGEALATFAKVGLVAVGHLQDEVVGVGNTRGGFHLGGGGGRVAVADVVLDAAEEQRRALGHQSEMAPQV